MSGWAIPFRGETKELNETTRANLPGQFIRLRDGVTHYELAGPPDGQVAVLIHGFSYPYHTWDGAFLALAEAGLRVLRYDLFGRGYSDRPRARYGPDLFERQWLDLLAALSLAGPADLVGLSMGGALAILFADHHPGQVRRLALIAPAGFPFRLSFKNRLGLIPGLGEALFGLFGDRVLVSGLSKDLHQAAGLPEYVATYLPPMRYRGFKRALLSTARHMPLTGLAESYARVGQQGRPTLLLWGRHDRMIPFETHHKVLAAIPHAEFHPIEGASHIPHYERPEAVNPLLIGFLTR